MLRDVDAASKPVQTKPQEGLRQRSPASLKLVK
jgi:hypothetical protein